MKMRILSGVTTMKTKKLLSACLLIISSVFMLTSCLERVELNKIGVVTGFGINKTEDGYLVTAQILNPAAIAGETQNALPVYTLTGEGKTIQDAVSRVGQVMSSGFFLSHLNVIVIDESFAEDGFAPLLNFALRHSEIRPDISIIVAKDNCANDVLNVITALDRIPAAQLNVSTMLSSHTGRLTNYNLYDVVDMVNGDSINVVLNAVSIHREEGHVDESVERQDGTSGQTSQNGSTIDNILDITNPVQLRIEHLAVFKTDKLIGFLDANEAQLYNIVMGESKRYVLITRIEEDYYTSARVTKVKSKITTDLENNEATIKLNLDAMILENTYPIDFTNEENLTAISQYLKAQFETDINDFVHKVQTELESDIFGIGGKAYYQEHKLWKEKEGYWSELFPEITINIEVELNIDSVGEIGNVTL